MKKEHFVGWDMRRIVAACAVIVTAAILFQSTFHLFRCDDFESHFRLDSLNALDRLVLKEIFDHECRRRSRLFELVFNKTWGRTVVWTGSYRKVTGKQNHVVLLDSWARTTHAFGTVPLLCVVFDEDLKVVMWREVCLYSLGFIDASLTAPEPAVITIHTTANWALARGEDKYLLSGSTIESLGEPRFEPITYEEKLKYEIVPPLERNNISL